MRHHAAALAVVSLLIGAALPGQTRADSNLSAGKSSAWGANIGWLDWRAGVSGGVEIDQFLCSGFIHSPNVGWIDTGGGLPSNGMTYSNASAEDFGVNVDFSGRLRGFAYGANIGWIHFAAEGQPRIDLETGKLSGFAYGANIGWISLGDTAFVMQVDSIPDGADSDLDGIPDAWEIAYANNLSTLRAHGDFDGDGQSDLEEYLANTDPTDPADSLHVLGMTFAPDHSAVTISWATRPNRRYWIQSRQSFGEGSAWEDSDFSVTFPDALRGAMTIRQSPGTPAGYFQVRALRPLAR